MLGSLRAFPGKVAATAGLNTRLLRRETKGAYVGGGIVRVVEKYLSRPLLQQSVGFASSSDKRDNGEKKDPPTFIRNKRKKASLRPGSDMKPPMGLEQLRIHPHETPQEINDRIFGNVSLYQEAKERGSTTPVMDAYRESADPIMLEKILQLARDVLPTRTGPRRNNVKKRESLRLKAIRKQNSIYREQKMDALKRKVKKKVERRIRHRDAVTAAIADDAAWLKEKDELILKHNEGKMEE